MEDGKLKYNLTKDTIAMLDSSSSGSGLYSPSNLRKRMLEDTINNFKNKYPKYKDLSHKDLLDMVRNFTLGMSDINKYDDLFLEDLTSYCMAVDIYKTYEGAQEFYLSYDNVAKIKDKAYDLREYLLKEDLKSMKIPPFENMIINLEGENSYYHNHNIQFYLLEGIDYKGENIYSIKVFDGWKFVLDAYIVISKLPRVFIFCDKLDVCEVGKVSNIVGDFRPCCLRTFSNCDLCPKKAGGINFATVAVNSVVVVYEVFKMFYKKPSFVYRVVKSIRGDKSDSEYERSKRRESNIIKINSKRYVYISSDDMERERITRESPCEHVRKEHKRVYKNGKVVVVKESVINRGKGTKIIKI
jgi:hypothetical protein